MESNGVSNKILCSQKTADRLMSAGKGHWLTARKDLIDAKGKGMLQTYWVEPSVNRSSINTAMSSTESTDMGNENVSSLTLGEVKPPQKRIGRLVDWNVEMFTALLHGVRRSSGVSISQKNITSSVSAMPRVSAIPRSEVSDTVPWPPSCEAREGPTIPPTDTALQQLRDVISVIGYLYRDNPFHSFEHASHVTMSTMKLIQRLSGESDSVCSAFFSDPLTQFAVCFAALVHDVDHSGVPNSQLVAERDALAISYENHSVAEQHSITIAWELLMRPEYGDLRTSLFNHDEAELERFRQLLVQAVIATDVFDKDLKKTRDIRWLKAFGGSFDAPLLASDDKRDAPRHAAIILDHLIQASDISHTMQHFQVYQKWSRRLFHETYRAFLAGRSPVHPGVSWYEGELQFFDNYVIPLAKKLQSLGTMFGFSCAELVDYAMDNRMEWERRGHDLVQRMLQESETMRGDGQASSAEDAPADHARALVFADPPQRSGEGTAMSQGGPDQPKASRSKQRLVYKGDEEWVGVRFV
jgi:3'5'-cyclic nucleotide phosphodiesterase